MVTVYRVNRKKILVATLLTLAAFWLLQFSGCGGSTTSAADSSSSALAVAYPDDLAVASLTASSSSSASISPALMFKAATVANEAPIDKKEDIEDLLNPASEAVFESKLSEFKDEVDFTASAPSANCYGPNLSYTDHPDATGGEPNDGQLPPGDLGIWTENESTTGEACVVAKLNNIIGEFENLINLGTKTVALVLGANSLEGTVTDLPAKGAEEDLTSTADQLLQDNGVPIDLTSATLLRESEDNSEGFPAFTSNVSGTVTAGSNSADFEMTLEHLPEVDANNVSAGDDDTYCGRLTQKVNIPSAALPTLGNCSGSNGITRCMLIDYCKDSDTSMTYHLRTGEFCGQDVDCGTVDPADKKSGSNSDGWGNNFYYTICNVNPSDNSGSCAQAWQAGANDGNTRVLNVKVNSDGTGCGYFGYGPDVAATSGVGSIDRMICNWAGPGANHTGVSKAQRQCFSKDSTGKFVTDSSNLATTYAPTNSCNKLAGQATFSYDGVAAGVAVTNNLIDLSAVDFTVPSLPTVLLP